MKDKKELLLKLATILGKTSGLLQGLQYYDLPDDIKDVMKELDNDVKSVTAKELISLND